MYIMHTNHYSDYPVILSLENHCSLLQQKIMADCLTDVLGDTLVCPALTATNGLLPSPESLKTK
jgi:phosphatidylinositol phospholipase C, eta